MAFSPSTHFQKQELLVFLQQESALVVLRFFDCPSLQQVIIVKILATKSLYILLRLLHLT